MALAGVNRTAVEKPALTVLVYSETPWSDGSREVGFLDGHAKRVQAVEWQVLKATLIPRWKRTAKKPLPANYGSEFNRQAPLPEPQ